jgi:ion channel-forming bestrophin family protein
MPLWRSPDDHDSLSLTASLLTKHAAEGPQPSSESVKTVLRTSEEEGAEEVPTIPKASTWLFQRSQKKRFTYDPEKALPIVSSDKPLRPSRDPPPVTVYDYFPPLRLFKPIVRLIRPHRAKEAHRTLLGRKRPIAPVDNNVALEILLFLSGYHSWLMRNGLLQAPTATAMTNNIGVLQDSMANLERILKTPLPFAYQFHLRMSLW